MTDQVNLSVPPRGRRRRRWRRWLAIALVVGVLLGPGLAVPATQGWQARAHLRGAATLLLQLQDQLRREDGEAARASLAALQAETAAAREATGGLAWRVGRAVPAVGDNVGAVRTVAAALDE